jgi:ribose 1,5-bisphosphate isomerase
MPIPEDIAARVEEIRRDHTSGARELASRAAKILALASDIAPESVPAVARALIGAQPAMAPMVNLARLAAEASDVPAACSEFLARMERAAARIAQTAAGLISDGVTVLTHSSSAAVFDALQAARAAGRRFAVIATESRPQCEGAHLAERLAATGIPVTLIVDAAMRLALPRTQLVFTGADSVSARGLVNKIGTSLLALAASSAGIPAYVLCGTEKFLPASYEPSAEPAHDPTEILRNNFPHVAAMNYYFETTPLDWFTGVVTEDGVLNIAELKLRLEAIQ